MKSDTSPASNEVNHSHLFTVRLWRERLGRGESEWRGKVEHIPSREACYFHEWSMLIGFLLEVLSQQDLQAESDGKSFQNEGE